jgi:cytochrome c peroxidase
MSKTYTYDPTHIADNGKDRMRFELGDTMVEGGDETCALTDEEYAAVMGMYPTKWKKAKLELVKSILHRFAYEVNTTVGPLSLQLRGRFDAWKAMHDELAAQVGAMGTPSLPPQISNTPAYFHTGMQENPEAGGTEGGKRDE